MNNALIMLPLERKISNHEGYVKGNFYSIKHLDSNELKKWNVNNISNKAHKHVMWIYIYKEKRNKNLIAGKSWWVGIVVYGVVVVVVVFCTLN